MAAISLIIKLLWWFSGGVVDSIKFLSVTHQSRLREKQIKGFTVFVSARNPTKYEL